MAARDPPEPEGRKRMKLGIDLDGRISLADMTEMCRIAEEGGFHSVWSDQHLGYREAVAASVAFLAATKKVTVVPTALSPYVAHPLFWAMGVGTLAEVAPGRVALCVGTANPQVMASMGLSPKKPLASCREMIEAVRRLWEAKGERVELKGETLHLQGAHIDFDVPGNIPIYLAAVGPKMCELSGEVADGVVFSAGVSPQYIEWAMERVERGRKKRRDAGSGFTVASLIMTTISENYEEALATAQIGLGYLLNNPAHQVNLDATGTRLDFDAIHAALVRKDWKAMKRLIPEKAVHAHSVTGTPDMAAGRIAEYLRTGLEIPVLALRGTPEDRKKALRLLAGRLASR